MFLLHILLIVLIVLLVVFWFFIDELKRKRKLESKKPWRHTSEFVENRSYSLWTEDEDEDLLKEFAKVSEQLESLHKRHKRSKVALVQRYLLLTEKGKKQ